MMHPAGNAAGSNNTSNQSDHNNSLYDKSITATAPKIDSTKILITYAGGPGC